MENELKIIIKFEDLTITADNESVVIVQEKEGGKKSKVEMSFDELSEASDIIGASVLANPSDDD